MLIYYFGYGSNMSAQVMQAHCPDHTLIGAAYLEGHQLAFTRYSQKWQAGVADVVPAAGHKVWGALYQVSPTDLAALDQKEQLGVGYERVLCSVYVNPDTRYEAYVYQVISKSNKTIATCRSYQNTLLVGAAELRLPVDYMELIKAFPVVDAD